MKGFRRVGIWGAAMVLLAGAYAWCDEQSQIDFANGLFVRGFYEDAAVEYRAYLDEYPNGTHAADALFRLGESEMARGRHNEAVAAFDELLNRAGTSQYAERARLRRAVALYEAGKRAEAEIALKQATASAATAAEAYYYLGKLYFDTNKPQESIEAFEQLTRIAPDNPLTPYARYQMAFGLLKLGQDEKAAVQFTEIANTESVDPSLRVECRFRAAETYDRLGWFDAAVGAYEKLRRDYPDSEYARRAAYGYAWSLYHAGKYPEATVAIEQYLRENPDSEHRAGLLYLKGNCLLQQERYNEAVAAFDDVRTSHSQSEYAGRAAYKVAWTKHMSGDDDGALAELNALLDHRGESANAGDAAFLRGQILARRGNYEDAYDEFRLVADRYPDSEFAAEALFKAGESLAQLERVEESMQVFDNYVSTHPDGPLVEEALLRAGDAAFMQRDFAGAITRYSKLMQREPRGEVEEEGLFRLGIALHDISNYKMCAETLMKLLEKYPDSQYAAEAHLLVADVYLQDGNDPVQAIAHYRSALDAEPDGKHAGDALKGLALARYEAKDYEGAADNFMELISKHPRVPLNADSYVWLGDQLYQEENWTDAIAAYGAFIERAPKDDRHALAWFRTGEAYAALGKPQQAIDSFRNVAAVAPKSGLAADAQLLIARQLEKDGKVDEAIALYEESANANNGESAARARFRLGEIYEEQAKFDLAARQYMRVAILFLHEELSPESLLRAGICYGKSGDTARMRQTLTELIEEFPESEQAAAARERLAQNE